MADHLRKFESLFTPTPQRMRMVTEEFSETLELGLKQPGQIVPMIPTYVFGWPTREELGDFLALDLGGTNLRIWLVSLKGSGRFEITQTKYRLTEEQKHDDGEKLFDFCAGFLQTFIETNMADVSEPGAERSTDEPPHQGACEYLSLLTFFGLSSSIPMVQFRLGGADERPRLFNMFCLGYNVGTV